MCYNSLLLYIAEHCFVNNVVSSHKTKLRSLVQWSKSGRSHGYVLHSMWGTGCAEVGDGMSAEHILGFAPQHANKSSRAGILV